MPTAKQRLSRLLALASQGPAQRAPLVAELAELVFGRARDLPPTMRLPILALFSLTLRETDAATHVLLAPRIAGRSDLPLDLFNEFYLYAPPHLRREILARNDQAADREAGLVGPPPNSAQLIAAAEHGSAASFAPTLAAAFRITPATAQAVLSDTSAETLAVLCRGARLDRATFSALVLLQGKGDTYKRLAIYEAIPQHAAERITRYWRALARGAN